MDFDECCFDAQKLVDNCKFDESNQDSFVARESTRSMDPETITDIIVQRLRQDIRYNQLQHSIQPTQPQATQIPLAYAVSGERTRPVLGVQPTPPRTTTFRYVDVEEHKKWCDFCRTWTNHNMLECPHRAGYLKERGYHTLQAMPSIVPRATLIKNVEREHKVNELALVPVHSY